MRGAEDPTDLKSAPRTVRGNATLVEDHTIAFLKEQKTWTIDFIARMTILASKRGNSQLAKEAFLTHVSNLIRKRNTPEGARSFVTLMGPLQS